MRKKRILAEDTLVLAGQVENCLRSAGRGMKIAEIASALHAPYVQVYNAVTISSLLCEDDERNLYYADWKKDAVFCK